MNQNLIIMTKNLLFSGIAGTIVYFLLGWLVYGILFPDLVSEGESTSLLYIFLGCLFYAFIYAVIFTRWANITNFKTGFNAGLVLGLLYSLSWHFFMQHGAIDALYFAKAIILASLINGFVAGTVAFVNGKVS